MGGTVDIGSFGVTFVNMILEGDLQREWGVAERRWSRAVFIGRDLDEAELRKGFEACAA